MCIDVRKNRERENDVKLHAAAIGYREVANSVWVVLRAVAIEVHEMRAWIRHASLLNDGAIDVDAPVAFVLYFVAGAREKSADVAAEIENPATFPIRVSKQFVKIWKLRQARRDEIPGERAAVSEERLRRVNESFKIVY